MDAESEDRKDFQSVQPGQQPVAETVVLGADGVVRSEVFYVLSEGSSPEELGEK